MVQRRLPEKRNPHPIESLIDQLAELAPLFEREVRFSPPGETWRQFQKQEGRKRWRFEKIRKPRLWRWDLACEKLKIAVEYDGGVFGLGAHTRGAGIIGDAIKRAHAQLEGWIVITVDAPMVRHGVAADLVRRAVWGRT